MYQKTALITGGNDGIGIAVSKTLLEGDYKVIIIDKNVNNANEMVKENKNIYVFRCDITNEKEVTETFKKIREITDNIDVLINSAGIGAFGDFDEIDISVFRKVMDVNFFGTVRVIKECLPSMIKNEKGHIINISSISGKVALPGSSPYCCSKWALEGFSESFRIEVNHKHIGVSVINPGNVKTEFTKHSLLSKAANNNHRTSKGTPVDFVVKKVMQVLEKPARNIYIPSKIGLGAIIDAIFPSVMDRFYFHCARKTNVCLDNAKVAVVTGASSGIGNAVASTLCARGLTVIMIARNKEKLFSAAKEISALGGNPVPFPLDIRDYEAVKQTIKKIIMDFGQIDILVNNAGYSVSGKVEDVPIEKYISNMETNFFGGIQIIKEVLPYMKQENNGHIINVLSTNAIRGIPNLSSYGATKFALRAFSRCLDRELARKNINIKVSEVFPASVETPFFVENADTVSGASTSPMLKFNRNLLSAEEVAKEIIVLLETGKTRKFLPLKSYFLFVGNTISPSLVDLFFLNRKKLTQTKNGF
ncbi:MAG: hypothetical protein CVT88_02615 [Candidatus Altiarchaeales archaeon HGW-Altiarchaeales-1]|nr:MAG: hypothetical protein CVT89_03235 [Candidatus Altiarchaeales archaeon HGW-Altiarchaeales-2]PKP60586.1 MAG: hypothetical protein CVT88_02615 [Candidatus Altiarchaeales archaeon HGW-Altiarchaeales-1]